jgi:hypothetical protein
LDCLADLLTSRGEVDLKRADCQSAAGCILPHMVFITKNGIGSNYAGAADGADFVLDPLGDARQE